VPCNTIAIVRAQIEAQHTTELLASPEALKALSLSLVTLLGSEPVVIRFRAGVDASLRLGDLTIDITRDGITATSPRLTRYDLQPLLEKVVKVAMDLAIPLAIQRTVKAVESRYGKLAIQSDTRQPNGSRVVKLKIPVRRG
jgi:hypothetical protein